MTKLPAIGLAILSTAAFSNSSVALDQAIYSDSLRSDWQDYGWAARNYANTAPVHSGTHSISVTPGAYEALFLHHDAEDTRSFASLRFWINGGSTGGQKLQVQATLAGGPQKIYKLSALKANTWQQVTIPLNSLYASYSPYFDGFWIRNNTGAKQATFYVDDIRLVAGTAPIRTNSTVSVAIDAKANVHPIDPRIYGVSVGKKNSVAELKSPLNRLGGNNTTRYNWKLNADNRANDYFFESIGDRSATAGHRGDAFIADTKASGGEPMVTIPMIPWVAKLGSDRAKLASFSVIKYGNQTATDPYFPDAGNGVRSDGQDITGNDPTDANVPNSLSFERGWVKHIIAKWGKGTLKYYILDNEPSIWFGTHRDVAPDRTEDG